MNSEHQKAVEKLASLKTELAQVNEAISIGEKAKSRREQLVGFWHNVGEVKVAELAVRDSQFPVWRKPNDGWGDVTRIIEVGARWIVMRHDGAKDDAITQYDKTTGQKSRTRQAYDKIDAESAIRIWAEWKASQ